MPAARAALSTASIWAGLPRARIVPKLKADTAGPAP